MKNTDGRGRFILKILIGLLFVTAGCSNRRAIQDWPETHPANPNAEQADPPVRSKTLDITKKEPAKAAESPHQGHDPAPAKGEQKPKSDPKHTEEHKQ